MLHDICVQVTKCDSSPHIGSVNNLYMYQTIGWAIFEVYKNNNYYHRFFNVYISWPSHLHTKLQFPNDYTCTLINTYPFPFLNSAPLGPPWQFILIQLNYNNSTHYTMYSLNSEETDTHCINMQLPFVT